jgi:hypothetical protein
VSSGSSLGEAFWHSTRLAQLAERVGYEALLGGREPQHAVAGQLLAGGLGRARGCPNQESARRVRWRNASQLRHRCRWSSSSGCSRSCTLVGPTWAWAGHPGQTRSRLAPFGALTRTTRYCSPSPWHSSGASSRPVIHTAGSRPSRARGSRPKYGCSARARIAHSWPERSDCPSHTAGPLRPQTVSPQSRRIVNRSARRRHCRSRTQSPQW